MRNPFIKKDARKPKIPKKLRRTEAVTLSKRDKLKGSLTRKDTGSVLAWAVGLAVIVVGVLIGRIAGMPALEHGWLLQWLAVGAAVIGLGAFFMRKGSAPKSNRRRNLAVALAVLTVLAGRAGARDAIVINGDVVSARSDQGKAYVAIRDGLQTVALIQEIDALLVSEGAEAAVVASQLEVLGSEALQHEVYWVGFARSEDVIDTRLSGTAADLAVALGSVQDAINSRELLNSQEDSALRRSLEEDRIVVLNYTTEAARVLVLVGEDFDIDVGLLWNDGPVE